MIHSVHGGVGGWYDVPSCYGQRPPPGQHLTLPPGQHPSDKTSPLDSTPGQQVGGMHPNGMLSFIFCVVVRLTKISNVHHVNKCLSNELLQAIYEKGILRSKNYVP